MTRNSELDSSSFFVAGSARWELCNRQLVVAQVLTHLASHPPRPLKFYYIWGFKRDWPFPFRICSGHGETNSPTPLHYWNYEESPYKNIMPKSMNETSQSAVVFYLLIMPGEAERRLERSDSIRIIPPFYITNNLPLVASLLARFAHRNF